MGIAQAIRHRFRVPREALRIVVGTGGTSVQFWEAAAPAVQADILPLGAYRFAPQQSQSTRIGWFGFVHPRNAGVYLRNSLSLRAFLKATAVDLAVIDSDYHCLPLLLSRTPIVALGQAWDVIRRYESAGKRTTISRWSMIIEKLDFLFQRSVSRRILVPAFESVRTGRRNTETVPLIVREQFGVPAGRSADAAGPIQVLLGGSGIGSAALLAYARRYDLPVIKSRQGSTWALDERGLPLIDLAPAVVIQGGLSSISECIARRRKMIVLPLEGHAEQLANALEVERRGLGLRAADLSDPPSVWLERLDRMSPPEAEDSWPRVDGAQVAAQLLLKLLGFDAVA
jgi:hypothetical protein